MSLKTPSQPGAKLIRVLVIAAVVVGCVFAWKPLKVSWHLKKLKTGSSSEKAEALEFLRTSRSPRALGQVLNALDATNKSIRAEAARALGSLGNARAADRKLQHWEDGEGWGDKKAIEALTRTFLHDVSEVRQNAISSLGELGCSAVLLCALGDREGKNRREAAMALSDLGDKAWLESVKGDSDSDFTRLGEQTDPRAPVPLSYAVATSPKDAPPDAIRALGRFKAERMMEVLLSREAMNALSKFTNAPVVEALLAVAGNTNANPRSRSAAIIALGERGAAKRGFGGIGAQAEPGDTQVLPVLLNILEEETDSSLTREVIESLARLGDPRAVPALAQSLERVSGRFGNDEGIIAFSFRLSQRAKAVDALGRIGHVTALPALRRLLGDPEPDVRVAAAKALAGLGETKWQACVTGDQKSDWLALGESREPLFRDALVRALLQGNRSTRRAAAKGLGLLGDNSAEEPLLQVLTSQESNLAMVRCAAALALADLKSSKAVEPLIRILGERTPAGQCELTRLKDAARLLSPLSKTGIADFMQEARMLQFAKWLGTNHVTFSFPFDYDISHFEEDMQELRLRELGCGPHPGTCESLVRCAAVIAFGSLGSDRAVAALRKARDDEDKWVSLAARLTVSDPAQAQWSALAKDPNKDVTGNTRDANASSTSPPEAIDKERSAFLQLLEAHWAAIETAKAQELATAQGALEKWKREWEKRRHGPDMRWRQLLSPPRMPPGWRPHIP